LALWTEGYEQQQQQQGLLEDARYGCHGLTARRIVGGVSGVGGKAMGLEMFS